MELTLFLFIKYGGTTKEFGYYSPFLIYLYVCVCLCAYAVAYVCICNYTSPLLISIH